MLFENLSDFDSLSKKDLSSSECQQFLSSPSFFFQPQLEYIYSQIHSEFVDKILGFNVEILEEGLLKRAKQLSPEGDMKSWGRILHQGSQSWIGLHPRELQTTYTELWRMCEILGVKKNQSLVDLGAGYGRMAFVLKLFAPEARFLGYEIVSERVLEGNRLFSLYHLERAELHECDLSQKGFILPEADFYFLYDFGDSEHIRKIVAKLKDMADRRPIRVVARGNYSRHLIQTEEPWLSQVFPAYHEEKFSVFSSASF